MTSATTPASSTQSLIDSTGILELVMFLEETFKFKIADTEVIPDNLDSINKIAAYVQQ